MTTDPIDVERAALALIEAVDRQDQIAGITMLTSASRDELIAMSAELAKYVVSLAAVSEGFDLAEWIHERRQRLLDKETGA
jgi:hypothetical protein